jgi:hypothetical protein
VLLSDKRGGFSVADGSPVKISSSVRKVALGDVNGDGKLDAVVADHDSYLVPVLLGDGRGGLSPAPGSPVKALDGTRAHTHEVVLGDVNLDRRLDILTTNVNDSSVSVLLGNGKGEFAAAPPVRTSRGPYDALVLRDFDRDRKPDLAMPNIYANKIDVMREDGKGGFAHIQRSPFSVGARPIYLGTADVNDDGWLDLLATHDDNGWLTILLNDGKGGFREHESLKLSAGSRPEYAVVADLNRDTVPDIVVSNYRPGSVSVFPGKRRGR